MKIRGTALHIAEKYVQLARDAQSSGDRVAGENYLQHAEHYYRMVAAAQAQMPQPQPVLPQRRGRRRRRRRPRRKRRRLQRQQQRRQSRLPGQLRTTVANNNYQGGNNQLPGQSSPAGRWSAGRAARRRSCRLWHSRPSPSRRLLTATTAALRIRSFRINRLLMEIRRASSAVTTIAGKVADKGRVATIPGIGAGVPSAISTVAIATRAGPFRRWPISRATRGGQDVQGDD